MGNTISFKENNEIPKIYYIKENENKYVCKNFQNKKFFENELKIYKIINFEKKTSPKIIYINYDLKQIMYECINMDLYDYYKLNFNINQIIKIKILNNLLQKLNYIHSLGIEHNDLKLENCVIDSNNIIYLIDFEVSTTSFKNPRLNHGTKIYMPPECFFRDIPTSFGKKDIWAFGILYCIFIYNWYPIINNTKIEYDKLASNTLLPKFIQNCFCLDPRHRIDTKSLLIHF
jgi:protein-serine/threonine kinase